MPKITSSPNKDCIARPIEHTINVLVIDDDPVIRDALKLILESNGYEVVLVPDGREGIIQGGSGRFCIAAVDLFLGDISGLTAIQSIREQQPNLPIILITAKGTPEAFSQARSLGVVGILAKPFRPMDILDLIAKTHDTMRCPRGTLGT